MAGSSQAGGHDRPAAQVPKTPLFHLFPINFLQNDGQEKVFIFLLRHLCGNDYLRANKMLCRECFVIKYKFLCANGSIKGSI